MPQDRRQKGWGFDKSIGVGDLVTLLTILVALWAAASRGEARLTRIEERLEPLWEQYKAHRLNALPASVIIGTADKP